MLLTGRRVKAEDALRYGLADEIAPLDDVRAAADAGADVHVVVLHRIVPAKRDVAGGPRQALASLAAKLRQPRDADPAEQR